MNGTEADNAPEVTNQGITETAETTEAAEATEAPEVTEAPVKNTTEKLVTKKKSKKKWWIIGGSIIGVVLLAFAIVSLIGLKAYVDFLGSLGAESRFGQKMEIENGRIYFGDAKEDCGDDEYLHCSVTADPYRWCACEKKEYDSNGYQIYSVDKPILYLYPEEETEVTVRLGRPETLTISYPEYQGGWRVLARPDSSLVDLGSGRDLYALYWESQREEGLYQPQSGFVVQSEDMAEFLEEKLAILGLNAREAEEFIVYWLPKLKENAYNFIYFATAEEIEKEMPINVEGEQIDTEIRVRMVYQGFDSETELLDAFREILDENGRIPEEKLTPAPARDGFVLVEWGGTELKMEG